MNAQQVKDCLKFYNRHFPEKGLPADEKLIKQWSAYLLPMDVELAMAAIHDACTTPEAARGFLPSWGAIAAAYQARDDARARANGWLGDGYGYQSAPDALLPALPSGQPATGDSPRMLAYKQVWRDLARSWRDSLHGPVEFYRDIARQRADCKARGVPYEHAGIRKQRELGVYVPEEELCARLVRRGRIRGEG